MTTLPLHPIVVHFPIALGLISPLLIFFVWFGILKWNWPTRTWSVVVVFQLILLASSLAALKTGELDEEKVESFVSELALEEHEEMGEKMPWIFTGLLGISMLPFFFQGRKKVLMTATLIMSLASVAPIAVTGHTGGKLVYEQGAANAHLKSQPNQTTHDHD